MSRVVSSCSGFVVAALQHRVLVSRVACRVRRVRVASSCSVLVLRCILCHILMVSCCVFVFASCPRVLSSWRASCPLSLRCVFTSCVVSSRRVISVCRIPVSSCSVVVFASCPVLSWPSASKEPQAWRRKMRSLRKAFEHFLRSRNDAACTVESSITNVVLY